MSIVQNPLIGRASGKMSNVIFQTSYDKNVIRSRPVAYRDAETQTQLVQRNRFSECLKYTQKLLPAARTGLARAALNKSVYNYLLSYIMKNAWTLQGGVYKVDPNLVIDSRGDLAGFVNFFSTPQVAMAVDFEWSENTGTGNYSDDDTIYAVFYCKLLEQVQYSLATWIRSEGLATAVFPESWNGQIVQSYWFLKSINSTEVSNTLYEEFIPLIS